MTRFTAVNSVVFGAALISATSVGLGAVVFTEDGTSNINWAGKSRSRVTSVDGHWAITSSNENNSTNIMTKTSFDQPGSYRLSFDTVQYSAGWNHDTAFFYIGLSTNLEGTGDILGIKLTTWGDGSSYVYNGVTTALDKMPVAIAGGGSFVLEYDASTGVLKIIQESGKYKDSLGEHDAGSTVLVDTIVATDLDLSNPLYVRVFTNTQWNGGGSATIDNITLDFTPVPEPATLGGVGLMALGFLALKRK